MFAIGDRVSCVVGSSFLVAQESSSVRLHYCSDHMHLTQNVVYVELEWCKDYPGPMCLGEKKCELLCLIQNLLKENTFIR